MKITLIFFRGINVLNTKTELEQAMAKRNRHRKEQERLHEQEISKTPFQKMLDERAKRLEKIVRFFSIIFFIISREKTMLRHHAMSSISCKFVISRKKN